jgi:predicted RNase H-like HicB family nuclease
MKYTVLIEQGASNYGAWLPDLPGCVAVGESREEVLQRISEALPMHLELMREGGENIPLPITTAVELEVAL